VRQILVDANVLASFLNDRNRAQQKQADELLQRAVGGEHVVVLHSITIVELVFVMTQLYEREPAEVAQAVTDLLALPGVAIASDVSWSLVLERWPQDIPSFGDAILATAAIQGRYDAVATFDIRLRRKLRKQGTPSYWSA
jgi:predicted nucleic acid-binding protein